MEEEIEKIEEKNTEEWQDIEGKFWKPENENDFISGVYVGMREDVGEFGSNVYDIQTKGELLSVFDNAVLKDKMRYVSIGQEVKIIYLGKRKSEKRKSQTYHDYKVQIKPLKENNHTQ